MASPPQAAVRRRPPRRGPQRRRGSTGGAATPAGRMPLDEHAGVINATLAVWCGLAIGLVLALGGFDDPRPLHNAWVRVMTLTATAAALGWLLQNPRLGVARRLRLGVAGSLLLHTALLVVLAQVRLHLQEEPFAESAATLSAASPSPTETSAATAVVVAGRRGVEQTPAFELPVETDGPAFDAGAAPGGPWAGAAPRGPGGTPREGAVDPGDLSSFDAEALAAPLPVADDLAVPFATPGVDNILPAPRPSTRGGLAGLAEPALNATATEPAGTPPLPEPPPQAIASTRPSPAAAAPSRPSRRPALPGQSLELPLELPVELPVEPPRPAFAMSALPQPARSPRREAGPPELALAGRSGPLRPRVGPPLVASPVDATAADMAPVVVATPPTPGVPAPVGPPILASSSDRPASPRRSVTAPPLPSITPDARPAPPPALALAPRRAEPQAPALPPLAAPERSSTRAPIPSAIAAAPVMASALPAEAAAAAPVASPALGLPEGGLAGRAPIDGVGPAAPPGPRRRPRRVEPAAPAAGPRIATLPPTALPVPGASLTVPRASTPDARASLQPPAAGADAGIADPPGASPAPPRIAMRSSAAPRSSTRAPLPAAGLPPLALPPAAGPAALPLLDAEPPGPPRRPA
ncbi:MAG: hypothetical protein AAF790_11130, partial [Planctomycetota bacterium]